MLRIHCSVLLGLIAILFALFTWLGGGIVAPWLTPWTPWMTLLIAEVMLVLPEQRHNESLFDARRRVWRGLIRDPLLWLSVLLIAFLVIQWLNAWTFLEWDAQENRWELVSPVVESWADERAAPFLQEELPKHLRWREGRSPYVWFDDSQPVSWLPWSLHAEEAWGVLNWFPPVLIALLAIKHALRKRSKRHLCTFVCMMTAVLALAGIVQFILGEDFLYWGRESRAFFFATFGYPNHAACYFPAVMTLAIGMLLWTVEHREHTRVPAWSYGVVAVLCAVSAILSGSRAGMLFTLTLIGGATVYIPLRYIGSLPPRLRWAMPVTLLLGALVVIGTAFFRIHAIEANKARTVAVSEATPVLKEAQNAQLKLLAYEALARADEALSAAEPILQQSVTRTEYADAVLHAADLFQAARQPLINARASKQMIETMHAAAGMLHDCGIDLRGADTLARREIARRDALGVLVKARNLLNRVDPACLRANAKTERIVVEETLASAQAAYKAASEMPSYMRIPTIDTVLQEIAETDWALFFDDPMLMRSGYQGILALRQVEMHPTEATKAFQVYRQRMRQDGAELSPEQQQVLDERYAVRPSAAALYPWYGAGAQSFRWLNFYYIDYGCPEERNWYRNREGTGQANVHNDTLQFLAEHGWLGFGLMCGCVLALVLPFMRTLLLSPQRCASDELADRCWVNRINVFAVFAFVATALIAFHSFIDLVFRSPACMMLYGLLFVCTPGFVIGLRKRIKS